MVEPRVRWPASGLRPELLVVAGGAVLAGITMFWNLFASPDSQYDEVVYTRAAQQVAQGWQLTWTNSPMFVHPPISFLTQGLWLRVLGKGNAPLADAILYARLLTAGTTVLAVLLIGLLAAYLLAAAGRRRSLILVGLVVLFAATDPVLLRYGRLALIEPIALVVAILALCLAIRLRNERALVYIPLVGLATGLALLTKEVTAFILFTPVVHALLGREWRRVAVTAGGFAWGLGLWLLFPLWAVALGLTGDFIDVKFATVQRLLGLIQITGWNRPGVSFAGAVAAQLGQYATSYLFLAGGALTLVWLLTKQVTGASRWLLAWLITSYAFAAYMVLLGTLNEQFFVYILPASIVGTVLLGDAAVAWAGRRFPRRAGAMLGVVGLLAVAVAGLAGTTWVRNYTANNAALFALTGRLRELPVCATVSVTGDPDKFSYLLSGQAIATFATAEGAAAHGVHLFVLSDKDVASGYGSATRELLAGVRGQGTLVAEYPSFTYGGLQLWRVPIDPYTPLSDSEALPGGGTFVITDENRCGGYPVIDGTGPDGAGGGFASGWAALGGKAFAGAPMTAAWTAEPGVSVQVFTGAVLRSEAGGRAVAAPVVPLLATTNGYSAAGMPPVTFGSAGSDAQVLARLTDRDIGAAYLDSPPGAALPLARVAAARARLGDPVGPVTRMPDGVVRQAFKGGVLERGGPIAGVRLAPIGRLAIEARQFGGAAANPDAVAIAATPLAAPPLTVDVEPGLPTTVQPFVTALLAGLALYTALPVVALELVRLGGGRRPRRTGPPTGTPPPRPRNPPLGPGGYQYSGTGAS